MESRGPTLEKTEPQPRDQSNKGSEAICDDHWNLDFGNNRGQLAQVRCLGKPSCSSILLVSLSACGHLHVQLTPATPNGFRAEGSGKRYLATFARRTVSILNLAAGDIDQGGGNRDCETTEGKSRLVSVSTRPNMAHYYQNIPRNNNKKVTIIYIICSARRTYIVWVRVDRKRSAAKIRSRFQGLSG